MTRSDEALLDPSTIDGAAYHALKADRKAARDTIWKNCRLIYNWVESPEGQSLFAENEITSRKDEIPPWGKRPRHVTDGNNASRFFEIRFCFKRELICFAWVKKDHVTAAARVADMLTLKFFPHRKRLHELDDSLFNYGLESAQDDCNNGDLLPLNTLLDEQVQAVVEGHYITPAVMGLERAARQKVERDAGLLAPQTNGQRQLVAIKGIQANLGVLLHRIEELDLKPAIDAQGQLWSQVRNDINLSSAGHANVSRGVAALKESIDKIGAEHRTDRIAIWSSLGALQTAVGNLAGDLAGLKADLAGLKADLAGLREDLKKV